MNSNKNTGTWKTGEKKTSTLNKRSQEAMKQ